MPENRQMLDYYEILGVSRGASSDEIKKAYIAQMQLFHPDYHQEDPNLKYYVEKSQQINEAYEILGNASKKVEYDKNMNQPQNNQPNYTSSSHQQTANARRNQPNMGGVGDIFAAVGKSFKDLREFGADIVDTMLETTRKVEISKLKRQYLGSNYISLLSMPISTGQEYDISVIDLAQNISRLLDKITVQTETQIKREIRVKFKEWLQSYCQAHNLRLSLSQDKKDDVVNGVKLNSSNLLIAYNHLLIIEKKNYWNRKYKMRDKDGQYARIISDPLVSGTLKQFKEKISSFSSSFNIHTRPRDISVKAETFDYDLKRILSNFLNDYCDRYGLSIVFDHSSIAINGITLDLSESFLEICLQLEKIKQNQKETQTSYRKGFVA